MGQAMTGLDRRSLLVGGAAWLAVPAPGGAAGRGWDRIVAEVVRHGRAVLAAWGLPGMSLALLGPGGERAVAGLGLADLERRLPVRADHLFQIGSISKSLVGLLCARLADMGRLDLDAPILAFMPDAPLEDPRVSVAHLLSHAGGLARSAPVFPVETGGRLWSATQPGARFHYSNTGYRALAPVIARLAGMPWPLALEELVLRPLGMAGSRPIIETADRARYARGYRAFRADLPWFPGDPLAEGPWFDIDTASGSVASPADDMVAYMRFLADCALDRPQALLAPETARRFVTPLVDAPAFATGARYGLGLSRQPLDGIAILHHTGGMPHFASAMSLCTETGAGCYASVNAHGAFGWRPTEVTEHALRLMRAWARGQPLAARPAVRTLAPVPDAARLAGHWLGPPGLSVEIRPEGDQLVLVSGGVRGRMRAASPARFLTDHPQLAGHGLDAEDDGAALRLWWGSALLGRGSAPLQPPVPERLRPLAGRFRSTDPRVEGISVVARGDRLWIEGQGEIRPHADGSWRFASPESPWDRFWFGALANGRAQRLSASGQHLFRVAAEV